VNPNIEKNSNPRDEARQRQQGRHATCEHEDNVQDCKTIRDAEIGSDGTGVPGSGGRDAAGSGIGEATNKKPLCKSSLFFGCFIGVQST
jgi:hypothetical protein